MDARVWQRYVAVACSQAWNMDVQATEELLHCIETLLEAAPATGSVAVRVLLGTGVGELALDSDAGVISVTLRAQGADTPDLEDRGGR